MALQAAARLANSAEPPDSLEAVATLDAFFEEFAYTGRHDRTRAELDDVRALRATLRRLLTSDRDTAVEVVNELLARHQAVPRLVRHGPWDWHLHATDDERPCPSGSRSRPRWR